MNRIQLLSGHGEIGGGEQMLLRIAEASTLAGWDVEVVGPKWGSLVTEVRARGLAFRSMPGASRRSYGLALAASITRRRGGLLWANGAMPALAATAAQDPVVVHLHQIPGRIQRRALAASLHRARLAVVPSQFMAGHVSGSFALPNWTEELPMRPDLPASDALRVGYVGRLSLDKGVDVLFDALRQVQCMSDAGRPVELVIGGDFRFVPPRQRRAVSRALTESTRSIEVTSNGWVDSRSVFESVDVCVVPSRLRESFGLVAAEAMASGCPVVVSDAGALTEVVGPDHPWVFRSGDSAALASMIDAAIDVDTGGPAGESTRRARARWEDMFSPHAGSDRLARILSDLSDI